MALQFDLNEKMRGILIDWLVEVNNSALALLLYISLESLFNANLNKLTCMERRDISFPVIRRAI